MGKTEILCLHKGQKYTIVFQIVNVEHGPLLSEKTCLTLGLVKYCFRIDNTVANQALIQGIAEANKIIEKHKSIFQGYGLIPGEIKLEIDKKIKPVVQRARRIPICIRNDLKKELETLEEENIIKRESGPTDWVHNILLVRRNNSLRICIDPVPLNAALKRPHFQFTTLDEILPEISRARVFSTVDAKKGFWQIKLSEESKLTTFWTPFGRYRWLRLPFGISPAPEIFSQKMHEVTVGLKDIEILADDILLYGCGDNMEEATKDHSRNLEELLVRLKKHGCKLNRSKLNLCRDSVKFFGHVLTSDGLMPDKAKVEAIKNMPVPQDKKDLLRFLGMITYLSRFIKNLSSETNTLRKLIREDTKWQWTSIEDRI